MDAVVYLALFVLVAVFLVSFVVLIVMCRRRRGQFGHLTDSPRFRKLRNEQFDSLVQLTPLLARALDKNGWVYDVGGLLQHCVAVLKLAHSISEQLSAVSLTHTTPQLQDIVADATHRIMPRFDDLLASVASPKVDVRILEARATSLATVCWSLIIPFSLINPKCKEALAEPLAAMDSHLEELRTAAELAEKSDAGKVEIDWSKVENEQQEPPGGDGGCGGGVGAEEEGTPAVGGEQRAGAVDGRDPLPNGGAVNSTTAALTPSTTISTIAETAPLLEKCGSIPAGELSPNGHPVDPKA